MKTYEYTKFITTVRYISGEVGVVKANKLVEPINNYANTANINNFRKWILENYKYSSHSLESIDNLTDILIDLHDLMEDTN